MKRYIKKPIVLLLVEGFGLSTQWSQNALRSAGTPNFDDLWRGYEHRILKSPIVSNHAGNLFSALELINFGARQPSPLDLFGIAAKDGTIESNHHLLQFFKGLASHHSACHIFAPLPQNETSYQTVNKICRLALDSKIFRQHLHFFYDSSDKPGDYEKFLDKIEANQAVQVASIFDSELIKTPAAARKTLSAIAKGLGRRALSGRQALKYLFDQPGLKNQFVSMENPGIVDFDGLFFVDPNDKCRHLLSQFKSESNIISFEGNHYLSVLNLFETPSSRGSGFESAFCHLGVGSLSQFLAKSGYNSKVIAPIANKNFFSYYFGDVAFKSEEFVTDKDSDQLFAKIIRKLLDVIKSPDLDFIIADLNYLTDIPYGNFNGLKSRVSRLDKIFPLLQKAILASGGILYLTSLFGFAEKAEQNLEGNIIPSTNPLPFITISDTTALDVGNSSPILSELLRVHKDYSFIHKTCLKALDPKI